MKTAIAVVLALGASFAPGTLIQAASGTPEVDKANATVSLNGQLVPTTCTGEDAISYTTYIGKWIGTQTETTPGATDYGLAGSLQVTAIKWTINKPTGRGVLTANVKLTSSTGAPGYTGKLTLVTQGILSPGNPVPGRGFIVAGFAGADDGAPPPGDDTLVANVEWTINPNFSATGAFGDSAPFAGLPNFSVVTNLVPKAADGTC